MIYIPVLILASILDAVPHEYVVDCGPVAVPFKYKMELELWARDGTSLSLPLIFPEGWDPQGSQEFLLFALKDNKWVARPGPCNSLIVVGTKKGSQVRSVAVKSEAEWPKVRWVPSPPPPAKGAKK